MTGNVLSSEDSRVKNAEPRANLDSLDAAQYTNNKPNLFYTKATMDPIVIGGEADGENDFAVSCVSLNKMNLIATLSF